MLDKNQNIIQLLLYNIQLNNVMIILRLTYCMTRITTILVTC